MYKKLAAFHLIFGAAVYNIWYWFCAALQRTNTFKTVFSIALLLLICTSYIIAGKLFYKLDGIKTNAVLIILSLTAYIIQVAYFAVNGEDGAFMYIASLYGTWRTLGKVVKYILMYGMWNDMDKYTYEKVILMITLFVPSACASLGMYLGRRQALKRSDTEI